MEVKIKSLWNGQIGVHEKHVKAAIEKKEELVFKYKEEKMRLAPENIKPRIKGISQESFRDRFKQDTYKLIYFDWKPDKDPQQKLL